MPAPAQATYSTATLVAAHTALRDQIDGAASPGRIRLFDDADNELALVTLTDPAGTVNGTTGQLSLTPQGPGTGSAVGTASWGTISDGDGNVVLSAPAQQGSVAVPGFIVVNSLVIVVGAAVTVTAATFG